MSKSTYTAAGCIVLDSDRVLVLDRPSRKEVRLPKGHIRSGEQAQAAAVRETREETGYSDLQLVSPLGRMDVEFEFEGRRYVRSERYFLMRLGSDATVPRPEKDELQFTPLWLQTDRALAELTFEQEREWLRRALARRDELDAEPRGR